jgi:hypothetical protein
MNRYLDGAACANHPNADQIFFPTNKSPHGTGARNSRMQREARAICAECPVRTDCLELALRIGPVAGIWGGSDEHERDRITTAVANNRKGRTA